MNKILVIAPHPDDETLGCGGTLLRHGAEGDELHWCIVTAMRQEDGFAAEKIARRKQEIAAVRKHYGFTDLHELGFPAAALDRIPAGDLVRAFSDLFRSIAVETLYIPYFGDAHSDHGIVAQAAVAAGKWFRCASLRRMMAYETLSETDMNPLTAAFKPNSYVDISRHLDGKIAAMRLYGDELGTFPFPRSEPAIRAKAAIRGSESGCSAAEAFVILKDIR